MINIFIFYSQYTYVTNLYLKIVLKYKSYQLTRHNYYNDDAFKFLVSGDFEPRLFRTGDCGR